MMLSLDTAYRSFGGEVEASSTPTICRLPDSRRHQLSAIALFALAYSCPLERIGFWFSTPRAARALSGCTARQRRLHPDHDWARMASGADRKGPRCVR